MDLWQAVVLTVTTENKRYALKLHMYIEEVCHSRHSYGPVDAFTNCNENGQRYCECPAAGLQSSCSSFPATTPHQWNFCILCDRLTIVQVVTFPLRVMTLVEGGYGQVQVKRSVWQKDSEKRRTRTRWATTTTTKPKKGRKAMAEMDWRLQGEPMSVGPGPPQAKLQ